MLTKSTSLGVVDEAGADAGAGAVLLFFFLRLVIGQSTREALARAAPAKRAREKGREEVELTSAVDSGAFFTPK